jgi:ADP-ribosylglycohydrolase
MRPAPDVVRRCIIAGAAGDAIGGIRERNAKTFSDDTQLTLATCEAIMAAGGCEPRVIAERMLAWFEQGEITGVGSSTLKALRDLQAGAHWALAGARGEMAAGNGAAMRAAPLAFVLDPHQDRDRTRLRDITRITHHHDEAYVGALAVVVGTRRAAAGLDWSHAAIAAALPDSRVRDNMLRAADLAGRDFETVAAAIGTGGFVAETVPAAMELARWMQSVGFESGMRDMNRLGGDADTIGAIAGQLWAAAAAQDVSSLIADVAGVERVLAIANQFDDFISRL